MATPTTWAEAVRAPQDPSCIHTGKAARETARVILQRIDAQGWKGKKRDTMAFELWMGALCHVQAIFGPDEQRTVPLYDHMVRCGLMIVSPRGYAGLVSIRDATD